MNRGLNLPSIQRIMNEFEKESATMDMKEEMMSEAVDDVMDDEGEDEEEEGDKILKEVLDEIGVDLSQKARVHIVYIPVCSDTARPVDGSAIWLLGGASSKRPPTCCSWRGRRRCWCGTPCGRRPERFWKIIGRGIR